MNSNSKRQTWRTPFVARLASLACAVVLLPSASARAQSPPAAQSAPTFTHDIASVLFEHCAACHRPGGPAPFALLTFDQVRARARQVVGVVTSRTMPPWKPDGPSGEFLGDRRLSDAQLQLFQRWLSAGAPQGAAADLPPTPVWPDEWELGAPDLVVRIERPYQLAPNGKDQLRNFVVALPIATTKYVRAWEFRTTNTRVVHHATLMLDRGGGARRLDAEDPDSGYEGLIPFTAQSPDGYFLGWTPGQRAYESRPDMAWQIDPGNDLIVMLHMRPTDTRETVDASVALYFSDRPPARVPVMIRLNRQDIDIAPGAKGYVASDTYRLPVDVDLYAVQPHAHFLAREISGAARFPDGTSRSLLHIADWDFHWQDVYRYREPVTLPAGTELSMSIGYDNSAENRANPSFPPKRVIWGQRSTDEMGDLWLQVVPRRESDHATLVSDLRRKMVPQDIDGYRKMLEVDPGNPSLHDDLALLLIERGDRQAAVDEFRQSARLRPEAAPRRYNLANAFFGVGRRDEAMQEFREAIRLDPNYGPAHQGLGLALAANGRIDEGASALEQAIRLMPASSDARYNLGVLRQQQGRFDAALAAYESAASIDARQADARYAAGLIREARGEYRTAASLLQQALNARPGWPLAQIELAWVLATAPDSAVRQPDVALRLASEGNRANAGDPRAADVLAAALAASGRYAEAALQARNALATLPSDAAPSRRDAMKRRLDLYEQQKPFILDAAAVR